MANEKLDLISRDEALEVLCNFCSIEGHCPSAGCAEYQKISKLTTVDAAPVVHGRWENIRFITTGDGRAKVGDCSSCKSIEKVRNYCPNCGAKIMGEYLPAIQMCQKPNVWRWTEVAKHPEYFTHWYALPQPPKGE